MDGKILTVPTPWDETLDPSAIVTEGKWSGQDKEENKDLLPVIWSVAPESRTQGPRESEWVRPTNDVPVRATEADVVELELWRSSYHLRKSLKMAGCPAVSDEAGSTVADRGGGSEWTTAADRGGRPCRA